MANKKDDAAEMEVVTGLEGAKSPKEAEHDLVTNLLMAAEFKDTDTKEVEIRRKGVPLFTVHLHPVSAPDTRFARKKATAYMPNPQNRKLPPIEKDFDETVFYSWLIYLATTEEDQKKIWGNATLMEKHGLAQPVEAIDTLLTYGEKNRLSDLVIEISGMEEEIDQETYAKN